MKNIRLTDKDLLLLRYLFEQDFVSRELIKKYIWSDLAESYVTQRLWRMVKQGYLKKYPFIVHEYGTVIMADRESVKMMNNDTIRARMRELDFGVNLYDSEDIFDHYYVRDEPSKGSFEHDLMVTEVRLIFERICKFKPIWVSERMLWKHHASNAEDENKFNKIYDGLIQFDDAKKNTWVFAVEVENNLKKLSSYKNDVFKKYTQDVRNGNINGVLYITTRNRIYEKFQEYTKADFTKNLNHLYIGKMNDIKQGHLKFINEGKKKPLNLGG